MNVPSVLKLIVSVSFLSTLPAQAHALTPSQVFDEVKDAIVVVKTLDAQGKVRVQGSGVLLLFREDRHQLPRCGGGRLLPGGPGQTACQRHFIRGSRGQGHLPPRCQGYHRETSGAWQGDEPEGGSFGLCCGSAAGLELSLSDGIVAQLRGGPPPLIQTTAAISPGSSGGGLFDGEGRLVGLTTLYIEGGQSLNFAMPVEWIGEIKPGQQNGRLGSQPDRMVKTPYSALFKLKDWSVCSIFAWSGRKKSRKMMELGTPPRDRLCLPQALQRCHRSLPPGRAD